MKKMNKSKFKVELKKNKDNTIFIDVDIISESENKKFEKQLKKMSRALVPC